MINTVTLNPALDKVLFLDELVKGVTNRVADMELTMGGKGTHVSMNLSVMGTPSRAFGIAYGKNGRYILDTLREWGAEPHFAYRENAESRTNYLLVEKDGTSTIVAEKGQAATAEDTEALVELLRQQVGEGDILVLSGDASNYTDPDIYSRLMRELQNKRVKVCLDASGETLRKSLAQPLFMIKPNQDELEYLLGRPCQTQEEILQALRQLEALYQVRVIAVSLGGAGSLVKMEGGIYRVKPPKVDVKNTIGCGDTFVAGLVHGFANGWQDEEILRWATAVSAAAAERALSVGFSLARAQELKDKCEVQKLAD